MAERQSEKKLLKFRSNNATEYTESQFKHYLQDAGIIHQTTAPYSSVFNGMAERVLRTIQEAGLTQLHCAGLSIGFWPESFHTVVYAHNRALHSGIKAIPFTMWTGKTPSVSHLRVFGSPVKSLIHPNIRSKATFHSKEGIFVGYYNDSKSFKIWASSERRFYKSRNVTFREKHGMKRTVDVHPTEYNYLDSDDSDREGLTLMPLSRKRFTSFFLLATTCPRTAASF
jgi:hypothetical protein